MRRKPGTHSNRLYVSKTEAAVLLDPCSQTADTCILFDSDWNPQWDLQVSQTGAIGGLGAGCHDSHLPPCLARIFKTRISMHACPHIPRSLIPCLSASASMHCSSHHRMTPLCNESFRARNPPLSRWPLGHGPRAPHRPPTRTHATAPPHSLPPLLSPALSPRPWPACTASARPSPCTCTGW